jgi:hypothetical protein
VPKINTIDITACTLLLRVSGCIYTKAKEGAAAKAIIY